MRIAIVNDMPLAVEILRRIVASAPEHTLAWVAIDGRQAVEKCRRDRPDLILMDLIMPVMDGVQATGVIMKENPTAILVVTATVDGNAAKVFEAMGCGALDAVATPVFGAGMAIQGGKELLKKIATLEKLFAKSSPAPLETVPANRGDARGQMPLVAIGSSTGGPKALANILSTLPEDLGAAFVIVQHVDAQFAVGLAAWLDSQTRLRVELAREGMRPAVDKVLLAVTDDHIVLGKDLALHYTPDPRDYPYRPSVNAFFLSVERHWPRRDVAVLLTGMGKDGAEGLLALRRAGWHTIAQDEKTSIVYGMPAAAAELNAAVEILPIGRIAAAIRHRIVESGTDNKESRKDS
jgi:two-component system, chemotaxis family, response regulator WspF